MTDGLICLGRFSNHPNCNSNWLLNSFVFSRGYHITTVAGEPILFRLDDFRHAEKILTLEDITYLVHNIPDERIEVE